MEGRTCVDMALEGPDAALLRERGCGGGGAKWWCGGMVVDTGEAVAGVAGADAVAAAVAGRRAMSSAARHEADAASASSCAGSWRGGAQAGEAGAAGGRCASETTAQGPTII